MDERFLALPKSPVRPDHIAQVANYLRRYPQDLIDAKRVLRRFRVSAQEFYQALLLLDQQPSSQSSFGD